MVRRVLDDWGLAPDAGACGIASRLVPARVRAFVDFLASRLVV
jgi:hypothetical protein